MISPLSLLEDAAVVGGNQIQIPLERSYIHICCLYTGDMLARLPHVALGEISKRVLSRDIDGLYQAPSLSCFLVKAVKRTYVVLRMRSQVKGLVLFCVKSVFILYPLGHFQSPLCSL